MNTPIYDALVAELRDQHRATVPFRRPTPAPPAPAVPARPASAPAPRTYDWFVPTPAPAPAPELPAPMAPLGLQDIARLLAAHDRRPAVTTGSAA